MKKLNKEKLLPILESAIDKAARLALLNNDLTYNKKITTIGSLVIEKKDELYIIKSNKQVLYDNIFSFDTAFIIAQRYNSNQNSSIDAILELNNKFEKYYTDMIYYLNSYKSAKMKKEYERMYIFEDRFIITELLAKDVKSKISSFKKSNAFSKIDKYM